MNNLKSVFEFLDYRLFLKGWVKEKSVTQRGQWSRMAKAIGVTSTMISQVMRGDRNLSLELANDLCDYIGFAEDEARHFLLLVDFARAGSTRLKTRLRNQVIESQSRAQTLTKRLKVDEAMTDAAKATFYSDWIYSAVRNASALEEKQTAESLALRFGISRSTMSEIVNFLVETGLCQSQSGIVSVGPQKTHVAASSPFVLSHHRNWRLKAVDSMRARNESDLFYTGPMSLSRELAQEVRRRIPTFLDELYKDLGPSKSEVVRCLNIDWFEF